MGSNGNYTAEHFLDAIEGSQGFITTIAAKVGCTRQTVYNAIRKYATVKQALENERERMKDFAEAQLYRNIRDGKEVSLIFYLKTQAKDRGYVERQELTGVEGAPPIQTLVILPAKEDVTVE